MEKNSIKEEIVEMLEVIIEQSEVINGYESRIPQIEIDIILSNIRELYDKFKSLEKQNKFPNAPPVVTNEEMITQESTKKPEVIEHFVEVKTPMAEENTSVEEVTTVIQKELKKKETVPARETVTPVIIAKEEKTENINLPVNEGKTDKIPEQPEKKSKNKKFSIDLFSSHTTIADKFKDEKKSLNEMHSVSHTDHSVASKLQKNPVKDLKAAIGINEKFKFINELFDGNLQKYNECISQLNGFAGSEAAFKYMSFLKEEFGWIDSNEAYHELNDLVTRRYIV